MSTDPSHLDSSLECLCIDIKVMDKVFIIICIYKPSSGNVNCFFDRLTEILLLANNNTYQGIYLIGDFNLDLLKHNDHSSVYEFINFMYSFSILPLNNQPT